MGRPNESGRFEFGRCPNSWVAVGEISNESAQS